MRLYSDTITRADIFRCLPANVGAEVMTIRNPRKSRFGYVVTLDYYGPESRRWKNSGMYGADGGRPAATWDEHGVWMAALYELDPGMRIANYADRDDFMRQTALYIPRGMSAPWLTADAKAAGARR